MIRLGYEFGERNAILILILSSFLSPFCWEMDNVLHLNFGEITTVEEIQEWRQKLSSTVSLRSVEMIQIRYKDLG